MNHHDFLHVTVYRRYRLSSIGTILRFPWCNVTLCRNCQQKHICWVSSAEQMFFWSCQSLAALPNLITSVALFSEGMHTFITQDSNLNAVSRRTILRHLCGSYRRGKNLHSPEEDLKNSKWIKTVSMNILICKGVTHVAIMWISSGLKLESCSFYK